MSFLAAALQALIEPAQRLGVPALPQRLLDLVVRDRLNGRQAWAADGRAAIEARGVNTAGSGPYLAALEAALEGRAGVEWARVNAPLGRVIVGLGADAPPLQDLVAIVDAIEDSFRADTARPGDRTDSPLDHLPVERDVVALAADAAGMVLAGVGRALGLAPLPVELAAAVSLVDTMPRLRGAVEHAVGRPAADTTIEIANAAVQGLAQGFLGLGVDAIYRVMALTEAVSNAGAWERRQESYLRTPETAAAAPIMVERSSALAPGPIEAWADKAGALALSTFAVAAPATGNPRQAAGLALAALPKAARLGREGFATQLGRVLGHRGALVLDPMSLRRLDRVGTVVLDADVLITGKYLPGQVIPLHGADPSEVAARLHALFTGDEAAPSCQRGEWSLGPLDELELTGRRGVRERRRLESARPAAVLGLARGGLLMAVAATVQEPHDSLEALAAACRRAGRRLVVAGEADAVGSAFADEVLPGGTRLLGTIRQLQAGGQGLLLLSRNRPALAHADIGVGVDGTDGVPPWGGHILIGTDLSMAALLIEACGDAASVSRHGVALAQAATALGGVAATTGINARTAGRSLLAVNAGAAVALAYGTWTAIGLSRRPLSPPVSRVPWHAMPPETVLDRLGTGRAGLTFEEVRQRRRQGANLVPPPTGLVAAVVEELTNPLTPILAAGAALSATIGSLVDAALVAGVTLAGALIGGFQRRGTDRDLLSLLARSAVTARALREGTESTLPAHELVPGDIVLVGPGDVIPADCRIIDTAGLEVDESSLTGESFPVAKSADAVIAETVAERTSMVYEGTTVASGRAAVVVVATGMGTEAGRSMAATRPGSGTGGVEARLARITRITVPVTLASAVAVVAAGLARGHPVASTAGAGVGLAVASVPEGLPFLVSAAQLASARRLSTQGVLVRNPRTIEALGRVNVLGFDKTGTLTQGRISVATVTAGDGTPADLGDLTGTTRLVLAAALRATPEPRRGRKLEHLTDRAVAAGAQEAGVERTTASPGWKRSATLPFEPSRGFHATSGTSPRGQVLSVKGAPESVMPRCTAVRRRGRAVQLDEGTRRRLTRKVDDLAGHGYRVLAVAEQTGGTGNGINDEADINGLTLLGFLALTDPVRPAAGASIAALRDAGVQILMITGDHPGTAAAVARRLDLLNGRRVITGPELDALTDKALDAVLPSVAVVARSTPAHKVRVVQAFQRLKRTVAMTGDGANDAPAIRLADVGIALGRRGTPAAQAAADLVVTDDRLETIISALVEGRAMWGSVRNALGILVGGNLGEITFTVLGAALTGLSPLGPRQLLLVNLLTDLAPALAVALRPPHAASAAALLAEGPEASLGAALSRDVGARAVTTALGAGAGWFTAIALGLGAAAPTVALASLVGTQLGQTLTAGGPSGGVVYSGLGSVAALALVIQNPVLSAFFGCTPLGLAGWAIAAAASAAAVVLAAAAPRILASAALSDPGRQSVGTPGPRGAAQPAAA